MIVDILEIRRNHVHIAVESDSGDRFVRIGVDDECPIGQRARRRRVSDELVFFRGGFEIDTEIQHFPIVIHRDDVLIGWEIEALLEDRRGSRLIVDDDLRPASRIGGDYPYSISGILHVDLSVGFIDVRNDIIPYLQFHSGCRLRIFHAERSDPIRFGLCDRLDPLYHAAPESVDIDRLSG